MRRLTRGIVVMALLSASFSVGAAKKQTANAKNSHAEKGIAAFYGRSMEGHKTACGSTYVPSEMTTAHRTLPCGTKAALAEAEARAGVDRRRQEIVRATVSELEVTARRIRRIGPKWQAVAEKS
jgi:hypothetical protein